MAALTTIFAIVTIALCCTYMSDFVNRSNRQSTSVGSRNPQKCKSVENASVVCYVFRNHLGPSTAKVDLETEM